MDSSALGHRAGGRLTKSDQVGCKCLPELFSYGELIRDHVPLRPQAVTFSGAIAGQDYP